MADGVAIIVQAHLDFLRELGVLTQGTYIKVPPALVGCVAEALAGTFADGDGYEGMDLEGLEMFPADLGGTGFGDPTFAGPEYGVQPSAVVPVTGKRKGTKRNPNAPMYQLKVSINRATPPIWRRLLVRSDVTRANMHTILQNSFEWNDSHLRGFQVGGHGGPVYGVPGEPDMFGKQDLDENAYTLGGVLPAESDAPVARCTGGRGRGPAEDCGGVWGWATLIEAVNDPKHPEHAEYREWLGLARGPRFDPKAFDKDQVTTDLARLFN